MSRVVRVKFLLTREIFDIKFEGEKLRDLVEVLKQRYEGNAKIKEYFDFYPKILVNGMNYELLKHLETELRDGDVITFLPMDFPLSGG